MKRIFKLSLLLAWTLSMVSCGKAINELTSAPKSKSQTGLIASCTSKAQALSLSEKIGVAFRVINEKRKLIEFVGASQEELEKHLPKAKFVKNKIYEGKLISGNFSAQNIGNDEFYGSHSPQYRNENSGRYFPHLEQVEALGVSPLGEGVIIAVVDTGVYYNHPHLSPNILTNNNDRHGAQGNSYDDDGNGYIDDYAGWDFYNGDAYPNDDNGHGTHVAGLAASTYMGIAPKAKILPVKVLNNNGGGDLGTIAAGIMYSLDRGAHIVNLSLGGPASSQISDDVQALINSVRVAKGRNALLIAAAGNGGNDGLGDCNDDAPIYPANIKETNLISVASVDRYDKLTEYSNFGGATVHVAAPGGDRYTGGLLSTAIGYCYGRCQQSDIPYVSQMGTSMATPIVAGLAAVIKSARTSLNHQQIKNIIMNTSKRIDSLNGLINSGGVINVKNAVNSL